MILVVGLHYRRIPELSQKKYSAVGVRRLRLTKFTKTHKLIKYASFRYELAVLDKNHRDPHAMGRVITNFQPERPSTKKVVM